MRYLAHLLLLSIVMLIISCQFTGDTVGTYTASLTVTPADIPAFLSNESSFVRVPQTDFPMIDLALSPDGKYIAGIRVVRASDCLHCRADYVLVIISIDSRFVWQIAEDDLVRHRHPSWSPDSQTVSFHATKIMKTASALDTLTGIWLANIKETEVQFLLEGDGITWAPDGLKMAMIAGTGIGNQHSFAVRIYDPRTQQEEIVFQHMGFWDWSTFAWSPDSQHIILAWRERATDRAMLYLLNRESKEVTPISEKGLISEETRALYLQDWTTTGQWLLYTSDDAYFMQRDGQCQITATSIFDGVRWVDYSGQSEKLFAEVSGDLYILDLREILGVRSLEELLSCPHP